MPVGQSLFFNRPLTKPHSISTTDALTYPMFKAMYMLGAGTDPSYPFSYDYCKNEVERQAFRHKLLDGVIRCGNSQPTELNFFENAFGMNEQMVDAKNVWRMYTTDDDYNVMFTNNVTAGGADTAFTATLLPTFHDKAGTRSFPAKSWSILDAETSTWYSIEDKDETVTNAHSLTLKPLNATVIGSVKKNKKYLVFPVRFVKGSSCPYPTNEMPTTPWMSKIAPFRIRRDWSVDIDLERGYEDQLQWTTIFDAGGQEVDAWTTFEAEKTRKAIQLALNLLAFTANPITSTGIINGVGTTVVDDVHTGFLGYLPSIKYGGGNVLDYDPSEGLNFAMDFEPFFEQQSALKRSKNFVMMGGQRFINRFTKSANDMVRLEGLGTEIFPAFQKNGETLKKLAITGYEWGAFKIVTKVWDALNDERLIGGNPYFHDVATLSPTDGVQTTNGQQVNSIEFFQYGRNGETGGFWEEVVDRRKVDLCEQIKGSMARSVMMGFNCPNQHALFQPIKRC